MIDICKDIAIAPDYLMACMALETGESFSPSVSNAAGSGAVGLIQFMPLTAENTLGTTAAALRLMTAESQLDYVKKYMMQYQGKMHTLEDGYMAILYPADIGQPASTAVFSSGTRAYQQNKGFDKNRDGNITISEISATVYRQYRLGMEKGNFG